MLEALIRYVFSWLPSGLWLPVWLVIAVFFLLVLVRLIAVILDWVFKILDIFI